MSDFSVFSEGHFGDWYVRLPGSDFKLFAAQIAANVIAACDNYPLDGTKPTDDSVGEVLVARMPWADHGFTNALLSEVQFLRALVSYTVAISSRPIWMEKEEAKIVAEALQCFQNWKTELCRREEEKQGKGWGSATEFYRAQWNEYNEKFLALWKS